jgi:hypothetical protein
MRVLSRLNGWPMRCPVNASPIPHWYLRMTRGRCGSLLLHHDGLAPSTPCWSPGALRSAPINGHSQTAPACRKSARKTLMHRSKNRLYSITSSALIKTEDGIGRPSNFAVRALMISSWLVGSSMGMSPGRVPFKILSIK